MTAPAGRPWTLTFDNKEAVPHNVAIFQGSDATAPNVFRGQVLSFGERTAPACNAVGARDQPNPSGPARRGITTNTQSAALDRDCHDFIPYVNA